MTKWKSPYYAFWKQCRSIKDRVLAIRGTNKPLSRNLERLPGLVPFAEWCERQDDAVLAGSIISARERYLAEHPERALDYLGGERPRGRKLVSGSALEP
jgi:hypothetical protein